MDKTGTVIVRVDTPVSWIPPELHEISQEALQWPIQHASWKVTSPFGMRHHPLDKVWRMHKGIDI